MDDSQVCPVCGIFKLGGVFYWHNNRKSATSDEVYSKVCKNAKAVDRDMSLCINKTGAYVRDLSWEGIYEKDFEAGHLSGETII